MVVKGFVPSGAWKLAEKDIYIKSGYTLFSTRYQNSATGQAVSRNLIYLSNALAFDSLFFIFVVNTILNTHIC